MDTTAFLEQAAGYDRAGDLRDSIIKLGLVWGRTHPLPVGRASELRHSIRSAQSSAVASSRTPSAMCSSRTRPSARRPTRAPIQYSSGTSEASVLNTSLLAGASPISSR